MSGFELFFFVTETGSCYTAPCCLELSFLSLPAWSTVTYHHAQLWARFKVVLLLSSFTLPTFKFLWDTSLSGAQRQYTKYKRKHRANENSKVVEARTRLMRPCPLSFWFAHLFFHQGSYNYSKHGFRHRWDNNELLLSGGQGNWWLNGQLNDSSTHTSHSLTLSLLPMTSQGNLSIHHRLSCWPYLPWAGQPSNTSPTLVK